VPSKKGGLGRNGLDSMFGPMKQAVPDKQSGETVGEISVKNLVPNPYQPRHVFDEEALKELTASVKESGIIQPLIVRKKGRQYEIVAGERRWRAAKNAGLSKVPVVIRSYDDKTMMEVALIENMQRSNLNPMEEARGIKAMMEALSLTQEEVAKRLGKSRTAVANSLRLLNLPEEISQMVAAKALTMGQVRPLLGLKDQEQMVSLAHRAQEEGWSARMVEEYVTGEKNGLKEKAIMEAVENVKNGGKKAKEKARKAVRKSQNIYTRTYEEALTEYLGTKVNIQPGRKQHGGKIVIEYYSDEDFERVYMLIKNKKEEKKGTDAEKTFSV
jgi:ParB family chromosome partitioning protein